MGLLRAAQRGSTGMKKSRGQIKYVYKYIFSCFAGIRLAVIAEATHCTRVAAV